MVEHGIVQLEDLVVQRIAIGSVVGRFQNVGLLAHEGLEHHLHVHQFVLDAQLDQLLGEGLTELIQCLGPTMVLGVHDGLEHLQSIRELLVLDLDDEQSVRVLQIL